MDEIEDVYRNYEKSRFGIRKLQEWLSTISFDGEFAGPKNKILDTALNKLELIRFTKQQDEQYLLGVEVAKQLVNDIKEFDRTHKVRRYLDDSNK